jgi:hypothetical protein
MKLFEKKKEAEIIIPSLEPMPVLPSNTQEELLPNELHIVLDFKITTKFSERKMYL